MLLDGVYHEMLNPNVRNGQPGMPITIRAKNDGKVIIDGEHVRLPVKLGDTWPGPIGNYFVIEGIIAKNSNGMVYDIKGDHNILNEFLAIMPTLILTLMYSRFRPATTT